MDNLIKSLEERYTLDTTPDVATTVAQGLIQLSSGIYTEEERYIFELLQNAVDAYNPRTKYLDIRIVLKDGYLVFMHNGEAFSERDIKGLCDIGNGNKAADAKKIGYKGIGFKSVFMRSSHVTVESGDFCFKFDKSQWENYWDKHWKKKFGDRESDKRYLMPWQIIPVDTTPPINIETSGYKVITYIQLDRGSRIDDKINKLLNSSQFLLFLKVSNIKISYEQDGNVLASIEKSTQNGKVSLSSNGMTQSQWLIYTNEKVPVPKDLMEDINADINTPEKLKGATTFDLSFAIALGNDGKIKKVDRSEAVVYTYLPTSYKFGTEGFPFLVNANFITDAGRQQLRLDSEWNKLIFSKIPSEFLKWMAQVSSSCPNYYDVLPKRKYGGENVLEEVYNEEMDKAIASIRFIPQQGDLSAKLLAREAVIDRMNITKAISKEVLISHINRQYKRNLNESGFMATVWRGYRILEEYGVFVFGKDRIKALLEDRSIFNDITVEDDIKLMSFLYDFQDKNKEEADDFNMILRETKFLLDEDMAIRCPSELFFSTNYKDENSLAAEVSLIHKDIDKAAAERGLTDWLSKLGVQTLSNLNFVRYLLDHDDYITVDNAIEIGRFIFHIYQTEDLFGSLSQYSLHHIKFLTTKGNLLCASDLYLGAKYRPELNLEPVFDDDIFVSDEYCEDGKAEKFAEWKVFLLKMGVKEDISSGREEIKTYGERYDKLFDKEFFEIIKKTSSRYSWISYEGWAVGHGDYGFYGNGIECGTFSFWNKCDTYKFSKLVFSRLFKKYSPENIDTKVYYVNGFTLYYPRSVSASMLTDMGCEIDRLRWDIDNCNIMPTVKKDCRKGKEVYSNAIPHIYDIAGDYLPILDVDDPVSEEWQNYLGLKNLLSTEDYLSLLTEFSNDAGKVESNKSRISLIYQKLAGEDIFDSPSNKARIKEWAKQNRILGCDNTFRAPMELSHITLDGFGADNRVYIGSPSNRDRVIELLGVMGVRIITENSIHPDFKGTEAERADLKDILLANISPLALISAGEHATKEEYKKAKARIQSRIDDSRFYHCGTIKLTYGNSDDVIGRNTFAKDNEFYYTGDLRPANIEPLLTPLCKYLKINGKERELFILMIEDFEGIRQNLRDKGYDVELLEEYTRPDSGTFISTNFYSRTESQMERDRITGFKGEIIVYEKLRKSGYKPVCPAISEKDFDGSTIVSMSGKTYYCKDNFDRYDMHFTAHNGVKVFVEVKATTMSKLTQNNMPISYQELSMIEEHQGREKEKYVIMRVFDVDSQTPEIYCLEGQMLGDGTFENI